MSGRKQKKAFMPSVQPSLEDILEESAVKNSMRNIARCVMKRRADRVQAKAGKQRPKKTEKSSPEVPKGPANHSSEKTGRPIGKRRWERLPATHRYNLRSRPKEGEEPINKQSGPASTKRRRKPIPQSPCSIEPERARSDVEMISVCSPYESPTVKVDLRSMEACSNQSLETPSDIYSAQLHSLENTTDFETPIPSFRKDSSQQLTGQMGSAVSTPKARNENGLDIYIDDFGIEYAFYEDPMRYTVTIEILDSPPEMTEKTASASAGDLTLEASTEDGDSETLVVATKTSADTSLHMDKTALTISDAERMGSQIALASCADANERVESTYAFEEPADLTHLQSEKHDIETTVTEALAANENSTRLTGEQHDFGGDASARVVPAVQESMPLLVEEEDADATCVLPSKEEGGSDDALTTAAYERRQTSRSLSTATYTEYEITERLSSSDEECDGNDEEPRKKIPRWANEDQIELAYVGQLEIEHPERIFAGCLRPITLDEVFGTGAELHSIRSSAQWDTSSDCPN
ncbi:hypothetical protein M514_24679 [Trichuris suis]|uniref:Inner centromere protein ARK-binding domain-containing protein n=2 Tax=Trichuris suis TaxID=68888 RepID=A0A085N0U6_9BILA|nr:hypothetical protein M514_24679 [Trichuris suis]